MGTEGRARRIAGWVRALSAPVDAASSAALRCLFGAVMVWSTARFAWKGWIQELYAAPRYHFAWQLPAPLSWLTPELTPWPSPLLEIHFLVVGLSALGVALGYRYRLSCALFTISFTLVELWDKTYYLNHYYLVSLIGLLLTCMPLGHAYSLDARRGALPARRTVPAWVPLLLRAQLAVVYGYAGLAKLDADWLLRAEPLTTWLKVHADLPVLGPLLASPATAHVGSALGAAFDLSVVPALCFPRTRPWAFTALLAFHVLTGLLLPIGVFPVLMIALSTIFLPPSWPRALAAAARGPSPSRPPPVREPSRALSPLGLAAIALYLGIQVLLPARHLAHPGDANWTDEGFRFAWRVMLIEKTGLVEFRLEDPLTGESQRATGRGGLTRRQRQSMATQPDMIVQYGRKLGRDFLAEGHASVRVYADAWASLNGRPPARLITPAVDLMGPGPYATRAPEPRIHK